MPRQTYVGLGPPDAAANVFNELAPYAGQLVDLQRECEPMSADYMAIGVALDGLQTTAYHFTRRPHFYSQLEERRVRPGPRNNRLGDLREAREAFTALEPYAARLRALQRACRPFGRDYMAVAIALTSLETAAFHFTRDASFYGLKGDAAGRSIRSPTGE